MDMWICPPGGSNSGENYYYRKFYLTTTYHVSTLLNVVWMTKEKFNLHIILQIGSPTFPNFAILHIFSNFKYALQSYWDSLS